MPLPSISKPTRLRWATALTTLVLTLAVFEIAVRLLVPREALWPISNIYRAVPDPGVGYTYRQDFSGTAFGVDLDTNRFGFRGPDWSREPDPTTTRIALIGDSIAFGFGIPFQDTLGERLARRLETASNRSFEVLNFGVNGHNARQALAVLETVALEFEPDLILVLVANNDFQPPLVVDPEGWLHWGGALEERTRVADASIERLDPRRRRWAAISRAYAWLRLRLERGRTPSRAPSDGPGSHEPQPRWMRPLHLADVEPDGPSERLAQAVHAPLLEVLELAEARNVPLLVATFCSSPDYRAMFRQLTDDSGIPVVELLSLFPEARSWPEFVELFGLGWDSHPGIEAQRRFAAALVPEIEKLLSKQASSADSS